MVFYFTEPKEKMGKNLWDTDGDEVGVRPLPVSEGYIIR